MHDGELTAKAISGRIKVLVTCWLELGHSG